MADARSRADGAATPAEGGIGNHAVGDLQHPGDLVAAHGFLCDACAVASDNARRLCGAR